MNYQQQCEQIFQQLEQCLTMNTELLHYLTQKNNAMAYLKLGLTGKLSLFIDDERFPSEWGTSIILRSLTDWHCFFQRYGKKYSIQSVSFDHDLGNQQPSGLAVLKSMIDNNVLKKDVKINVHSQNPVGAKQIKDYFESFKNQP